MNQDKIIIIRQQKIIDDLKIERIFFKDKAKYYQNELKELKSSNSELERKSAQAREGNKFWIDKYNQLIKEYKELSNQIYDLENENEEIKSKIYDLEVNNQTLEAEITYWEETAINWRDKYKEAESELQHQKETAYHWKEKYLKELTKHLTTKTSNVKLNSELRNN